MIAIKNVKIPDGGCLFCPFEYGFDCRNRESIRKSARGDGRPDWCPLIETKVEDEDLKMQIIKDRLLRQERIREIYDE